MHRFVFCLYRQTTVFNDEQVEKCVKHFRVRQGIRTHNFISSLQGEEGISMVDSTPVGIEAFLCEWEKGVDSLSRVKQPNENDEFSLDSSNFTNPSVYMSTPIDEFSSSKSASRAKSFQLRRNIRFYKDIILSMVEKNSSEPSDERKGQDPQRSKSLELFHSDTYKDKENAKNSGNLLSVSTSGIPNAQTGSANRHQSSQNGAESSFLSKVFSSPSSLLRSSFSFDYSGKGNKPQTASPPTLRSQSPVISNGATQKKFSPFLILSLATSPKELCNMLGVESTGMFDGEMIKKKFSLDFIFKENFVWLESLSRSIHWAKNIAEKSDPASSRYIMLAKTRDSNMLFGKSKVKQAEGEMRGTAIRIEETPWGIA
eukprot:gene785-1057_t